YAYSYRRIRDGDLPGARGPTLALGILGIPLGGIIVGILYLIAYMKIGDAETESRSMGGWQGAPGGAPPAYGYAAPYGGPASAGVPPLYGGVAYAPPPPVTVAHNCPRCGRPATFIPQYGSSYCYSCAQYL
ncbi:MAG TPA: hypothetical protein VJQ43_06550, partial [Thermoplasmata archaeon]|nr:hypothetical protein [Thermoplasmata archaeon]